MASTNKTTNYELSQFLGGDKPAWLSDYNTDMNKIDTAIKNAADTAVAAGGTADAATTAIGTLTNLTTDDKTNIVNAINEVDLHADAASTSATTANGTANLAAQGVADLNAFLNINTFANLTVSAGSGATIVTAQTKMHSAINSDGSLGKIYGVFQTTKTSSGPSTITFSDTGLRPSSQITIANCVQAQNLNNNTMEYLDLVINTDGTATVVIPSFFYNPSSSNIGRCGIVPFVIFAKDFGD